MADRLRKGLSDLGRIRRHTQVLQLIKSLAEMDQYRVVDLKVFIVRLMLLRPNVVQVMAQVEIQECQSAKGGMLTFKFVLEVTVS
jgi:hypothetical protein